MVLCVCLCNKHCLQRIHLGLSTPGFSWNNCGCREYHPGVTWDVAHHFLLVFNTFKLSFQVIPTSALLMGGSHWDTLEVSATMHSHSWGRQGWINCVLKAQGSGTRQIQLLGFEMGKDEWILLAGLGSLFEPCAVACTSHTVPLGQSKPWWKHSPYAT